MIFHVSVCVHAILILGLRFQINHFDILPVAYVKRLNTADETTGENKLPFDKNFHLIIFFLLRQFFLFLFVFQCCCFFFRFSFIHSFENEMQFLRRLR